MFYQDLTCDMLNQTENSNDNFLIIKYMLNMRKFQIRLATLLIYLTAFKLTVLISSSAGRANNLILPVLELNVVKNSNKVI